MLLQADLASSKSCFDILAVPTTFLLPIHAGLWECESLCWLAALVVHLAQGRLDYTIDTMENLAKHGAPVRSVVFGVDPSLEARSDWIRLEQLGFLKAADN